MNSCVKDKFLGEPLPYGGNSADGIVHLSLREEIHGGVQHLRRVGRSFLVVEQV